MTPDAYAHQKLDALAAALPRQHAPVLVLVAPLDVRDGQAVGQRFDQMLALSADDFSEECLWRLVGTVVQWAMAYRAGRHRLIA